MPRPKNIIKLSVSDTIENMISKINHNFMAMLNATEKSSKNKANDGNATWYSIIPSEAPICSYVDQWHIVKYPFGYIEAWCSIDIQNPLIDEFPDMFWFSEQNVDISDLGFINDNICIMTTIQSEDSWFGIKIKNFDTSNIQLYVMSHYSVHPSTGFKINIRLSGQWK